MINSDYVSDIIFNVCKQIFHSNKVYLKVYYDNEKFLAVELEDLEAKLEVATQYICDNLTPDVVTAISKFLGYDVEGYNGDEVYVELLFKTIKILKDNYDITVTEDERPMNY